MSLGETQFYSSTNKVASDRKPQVVIGVSVIEFVDSWPHLGHIIASRKFASVSGTDKTFGLRNKDGKFTFGTRKQK